MEKLIYLNLIAESLGISLFWLAIILIWSAVWKLIALWKAARKNSPVWFVVLAIINTAGILEILYIFVFSKMNGKSAEKPKQKLKRRR